MSKIQKMFRYLLLGLDIIQPQYYQISILLNLNAIKNYEFSVLLNLDIITYIITPIPIPHFLRGWPIPERMKTD